MRRREFIAALGGAVVPALWFSGAHAQQPERMRRIAILMLRQDAPEGRRLVMEFRRRLEALGWADGRNIRADYRWVAGEIDRIGDAAKETVEQRPEVILAEGTVTVAALSRESGAIPIVFINVSDPIG